MPLILTAIDLKLSPTHSALSARLARFNALTEIVKHAESCYEVTDFVAVGINYVLRLAYLTTRVVFRSRSRTGIASSRAVSRTQRWVEDQGKEDGEGKKNRGGTRGVVMKDGPKVTSWVDAFIVWPRAYLLISSSVDRSLAVGRLPSRQSLPELVRNIPAMGADFRLPWSVGSGQGGGERLERLEGRKRRRIGAVDEDCGRGQREDEVREEERQQEGNEKVNLNFLDLGAVSPGVVESEEEQEQQGEQQGEGEAGLEFDAALLDTISNELFMADVAT